MLAAHEAQGEGDMDNMMDRGTPVGDQGISGLTASLLAGVHTCSKACKLYSLHTHAALSPGKGRGRRVVDDWISEEDARNLVSIVDKLRAMWTCGTNCRNCRNQMVMVMMGERGARKISE